MQSNVSFYRGGRGKCDPRAEEGDVKIEAETRVMWEEAKECWQPLEAERQGTLPEGIQRKHSSANLAW